jgi:hypothetical protein
MTGAATTSTVDALYASRPLKSLTASDVLAAYPKTCSFDDAAANAETNVTWTANFIMQPGKTAVTAGTVLILKPQNGEISGYIVKIGSAVCAALPETDSDWAGFKCGTASGATGTTISISNPAAGGARFCGLKVLSSGVSDGSSFTSPGAGVAIAVDDDGVPYVVNTYSELYKRKSDATWQKLSDDASQVMTALGNKV